MVSLFGFGDEPLILGKLVLRLERDAVDTGEHLVVLVRSPVRAGLRGHLEGFEGLGVGDVRAGAHVDVIALLEEADLLIFRKVVDVLEFVFRVPFRHQSLGLVVGQDERFEREVLLDDLPHLIFDALQVLVCQFGLSQVDVIIEPFVSGGTEGEVRFRPEALDGLRHDVGRRVADDFQFFLGRADDGLAVGIDDFHRV